MKNQIKGFLKGVILTTLIFIGIIASASQITKDAVLSYNNIKICIDGNYITSKDVNGNIVEPFIIDGTTYLPVRAVASALGMNVRWDGETSTVFLDEKTSEEPETVGNNLLSVFKENSSGSALSVAEKIIEKGNLPFSAGAMEVEPGFLLGFDNTEINDFKSAAMFSPMIGSIPFVGYVFELEDGVLTSDFIEKLEANANLRWNICVEAEEMVTGSSENKVFFVMCPKTFEE